VFASDLGEVLVKSNLHVGEAAVLICEHYVVNTDHRVGHGSLEVRRQSRVLILSN
jgi:hypothetical protein